MGRWNVHIRASKKKSTAEQQRQQHKAALLQACKEGRHTMTPTFRLSETMCFGCGAVFYCPGCFKQNNLSPAKDAYAFDCSLHQHVEVSTCQN